MSGAKVMFISREHLTLVLRGEARIRNLPPDAEISAFLPHSLNLRAGLALRIQSATFPVLCAGTPLPTMTAVLEAASVHHRQRMPA